MREGASGYQPAPGESRGRRFKEEVAKLKEQGPAAQAKFLLENAERYPKHADQVLANLIPKVETQLREAGNKLAERAKTAAESALLARYYQEYSALSERQKTLNGFAAYVEKRFREEAPSGDPQNGDALKRLLARAGKNETKQIQNSVGGIDRPRGRMSVPARERYDRSADTHAQEVRALAKTVEDSVAALKGIEEYFGYELVDEGAAN